MRVSHVRHQIVRGTAGLSVVMLGFALASCSATPPKPTPAPPTTTVMMGMHTHSIATDVSCTHSAAQADATPPESGDLTTRITAHDDSASLSLALSDEKPPSVDGFAVSLKVGDDQYSIPYQATETPTQVQVSRNGNSYTVTGSGQAVAPRQSGMHQLTFGIHVTCP